MSVLKRCCVCDGPIADGRCSWCGMPDQNEEGRYHLNENLRDHLAHMSEKERQEYFRKQQSLYTQPGQQAQPQMSPRQPSYTGSGNVGGAGQPYRPGPRRGPGPSATPPYCGNRPPGQPQQKKNGLAGFFVFFFILLCVIIPLLQSLFG